MDRAERTAEPMPLPQRSRGTAANEPGGGPSGGDPGAGDLDPPPLASLVRVLEGLKRLG